jgi:ribosomal protein S18 acetylase RimI-like enzyme
VDAMARTDAEIVLRCYGAREVPPLVDVLADVWTEAHPELVPNVGAGTEGLSADALRAQITSHLRHLGFTLVAAYAGGSMVGFGYAFPCSPEYWFGTELLPQIPDEAKSGRLMGLCELAVRTGWQSQGIGTRLHAELIRAIAPEWSSLLVRPTNNRARTLYEHLGYRHAGQYRNTPDGPVFDLLLLRVQN